ncbi:MAG: iron chelate uptake ABC transporter family permease subunit [Halobacterium sp.]
MSRQYRVRDALLPDLDAALASIVVGSTALVLFGALVQIRYGAYEMPFETVWRALFDGKVWTNPEILATIVLGDGLAQTLGVKADLSQVSDATAVVWTMRLPRVAVAVFVGTNLAVAGAIF